MFRHVKVSVSVQAAILSVAALFALAQPEHGDPLVGTEPLTAVYNYSYAYVMQLAAYVEHYVPQASRAAPANGAEITRPLPRIPIRSRPCGNACARCLAFRRPSFSQRA